MALVLSTKTNGEDKVIIQTPHGEIVEIVVSGNNPNQQVKLKFDACKSIAINREKIHNRKFA